MNLGPYEPNTIHCGASEELLARLPDDCIDLTVTSPPYDNLRDYNGFTLDWHEIIRQLYRVTKPGGVVVWVVADATINGSETGTSFRQALWAMECGFNLHDTMIYEKSGFPFPESNRYNPVFEYMFILSKGTPLRFNPIEDRKNVYAGDRVARFRSDRQVNGDITPNTAWKTNKAKRVKEHGRRNNIWYFAVGGSGNSGDKLAHNHPASFPEALARDHILSWSNKQDLCLDPFVGSGTTAKMAFQNGRHYLGFDISEEYCELARKRVAWANPPLLVID